MPLFPRSVYYHSNLLKTKYNVQLSMYIYDAQLFSPDICRKEILFPTKSQARNVPKGGQSMKMHSKCIDEIQSQSYPRQYASQLSIYIHPECWPHSALHYLLLFLTD